jgi:hypothetical protein
MTTTFQSNVQEVFEQLWKEEYGSFWQHITCLSQWLNFIWLINETVARMSLCLQSRVSLTSRETFKPFEPLERQSIHFLRGWSSINWTTKMIRKYPTERSRNNIKKECSLQLALMWSNWIVKLQTSLVVQQTTATGKMRRQAYGIHLSSTVVWWTQVLSFLWRLLKIIVKISCVGNLILSQERKFGAWNMDLCIGRRKHVWDVRSDGIRSNLSVVQNVYCRNVEWWTNRDFVGYG